MTDSDETLTAYHEAGHAVVAHLLGGEVQSVSIEDSFDSESNRLGDTAVLWRGLDERERALNELASVLAGPIAEAIYRDDDVTLDDSSEWLADLALVARLSEKLHETKAKQKNTIAVTCTRLRRWFQRDENWAAVAAVADELATHELLDADQFTSIVSFWQRHAESLNLDTK